MHWQSGKNRAPGNGKTAAVGCRVQGLSRHLQLISFVNSMQRESFQLKKIKQKNKLLNIP
jgi:hypothetical protein